MRKQIGVNLTLILVDIGALRDAVVAGLMVLQSEVSNVVTQCHEEVVAQVMARTEECTSLVDQPLVIANGFVGHLKSGGAVRSEINEVRALGRR